MAAKNNNEKLLEQIRRDYRLAVDRQSENRQSQLDDYKFAAGSPDNKWQWDTTALATRSANGQERPALTINQLPQHIRQVTNEERQNRPTAKVLPVDDKADPETAQIFNGILRHINVASDGDLAIDTACECQVTAGEGFFRIVAEYCDPMSFDQDLRYKRLKDAFSVRMDPRIQIPTGEDAKFCFIETEMSKEEFEATWPDAQEVSWNSADPNLLLWNHDGQLVVAEYYWIESKKVTLCLWPDGVVTEKGSPQEAAYVGQSPIKERKATIPQIKWCKTNGHEILGDDIKDIPGPFIPVFRVVGNEWVVEGKNVVSGIVRNAKDPQRMVNYWTSQEAELLALAPKAPFVGYAGQFEGFETKWDNANVIPFSYLEANAMTDASGTVVLPLPQRMAPPMPPAGVIEAKMQAVDAVKQTTGQYNPSLGAQSNETSGKAIIARQRESDVGTYHYVDNLGRAIRSAASYLVATIPIYYDRPRIARIIGEDGEPDHAQIDPEQEQAFAEKQAEEGQEIEKIYNLSVGKYDVVAAVGPSYTTKRLEAQDAMTQILQGNEALWPVVGDLVAKNMDWPGADEFAERIKRWIQQINPNVIGEEKGQPSDPRLEQAMTMVDQLTQSVNELSSALESQENKIKVYDAETKRLTAIKDAIPPDLWPEIVMNSGVLTSEDLDQVAARGGVIEEHPKAPPPKPTNGARAPPMQ